MFVYTVWGGGGTNTGPLATHVLSRRMTVLYYYYYYYQIPDIYTVASAATVMGPVFEWKKILVFGTVDLFNLQLSFCSFVPLLYRLDLRLISRLYRLVHNTYYIYYI